MLNIFYCCGNIIETSPTVSVKRKRNLPLNMFVGKKESERESTYECKHRMFWYILPKTGYVKDNLQRRF